MLALPITDFLLKAKDSWGLQHQILIVVGGKDVSFVPAATSESARQNEQSDVNKARPSAPTTVAFIA